MCASVKAGIRTNTISYECYEPTILVDTYAAACYERVCVCACVCVCVCAFMSRDSSQDDDEKLDECFEPEILADACADMLCFGNILGYML